MAGAAVAVGPKDVRAVVEQGQRVKFGVIYIDNRPISQGAERPLPGGIAYVGRRLLGRFAGRGFGQGQADERGAAAIGGGHGHRAVVGQSHAGHAFQKAEESKILRAFGAGHQRGANGAEGQRAIRIVRVAAAANVAIGHDVERAIR